MNAARAIARFAEARVSVVSSGEAALLLQVSLNAASKLMQRLSAAGAVTKLCRGLWGVSPTIDPYELPEHLVAPFPAYVSLHSALHLHGMVEQIPPVIYCVTLGRTRRITTSLGTYSFHRVDARFFDGFDVVGERGVKLATPEKALADLCYLASTRLRLFSSLPELTLPRGFSSRRATAWLARVQNPKLQQAALDRLNAHLHTAAAAQTSASG